MKATSGQKDEVVAEINRQKASKEQLDLILGRGLWARLLKSADIGSIDVTEFERVCKVPPKPKAPSEPIWREDHRPEYLAPTRQDMMVHAKDVIETSEEDEKIIIYHASNRSGKGFAPDASIRCWGISWISYGTDKVAYDKAVEVGHRMIEGEKARRRDERNAQIQRRGGHCSTLGDGWV